MHIHASQALLGAVFKLFQNNSIKQYLLIFVSLDYKIKMFRFSISFYFFCIVCLYFLLIRDKLFFLTITCVDMKETNKYIFIFLYMLYMFCNLCF